MRRCIVCVLLVVLGACGDDDGEPADSMQSERDFIATFDGEEVDDYKGHPVKVDEATRVVVVGDCAIAKELTKSGAPYGPDGDVKGYGYVCP